MILERHDDNIKMEVYLFPLFIIAADLFGLAFYYFFFHCMCGIGKAKRSYQPSYRSLRKSRGSSRKISRKNEQVELLMPPDHDELTSDTHDRQPWTLTFNVQHQEVKAYSDNLLDAIVRILHSKLNNEDIQCRMLNDHEAAVEMIIGHSGGDLTRNPLFQDVTHFLHQDEAISDIKLHGPGHHDINNMNELIQVSFKTKGDDNLNYAVKVIDEVMAVDAFRNKVHDHEINIVRDDKAEVVFILREKEKTVMHNPVIQNMLAHVKNKKRCKSICVKVVGGKSRTNSTIQLP